MSVPAETFELPSKGWFYPAKSPLASGKIELYYMTAKHEDILTSKNLIQNNLVYTKLIESLIATPGVKIEDLLLADREAILIAARILAYGKEYITDVYCPECKTFTKSIIDLETIETIDSPLFTDDNKHKTEFYYELPISKKTITFRFLTIADEIEIEKDLTAYRKLNQDVVPNITARMVRMITSIDSDRDPIKLRQQIQDMKILDSKNFKEYYQSVLPKTTPDAHFKCTVCKSEGRVEVPLNANFFWPSTD